MFVLYLIYTKQTIGNEYDYDIDKHSPRPRYAMLQRNKYLALGNLHVSILNLKMR